MFETLTDPLFRDAMIAGLLMASAFSLLGVFVVLRRVVFIGMTMAQVASAGTAFAFYLAAICPPVFMFFDPSWWRHWGDILCSTLFTLVAVFVVARGGGKRRVTSDGAIGFTFAAFWALGILFVARSGQGIAEVRNLVQGDLLLICTYHLLIVGAVAFVVWFSLMLSWKENVLVAFDPDFAAAIGLRSRRWDFAFYALLGASIVAGVRFAGLLLIFTWLVVPPIAGLLMGGRPRRMAGVSVSLALVATLSGLGISFTWDLPASPVIAISCVIGALFVGLISAVVSRFTLSWQHSK